MNSKAFLKKVIVIAVVFQLALGQALFAATTDKNITLDDNDVDSPLVIMRDQDENIFTLQKLDGGAAELINNEGSIDFKPSAITSDYLRIVTEGSSPDYASSLYWMGVLTYTDAPGLRVDPATGKLEYRDENESAWTAFDSMSGTIPNDSTDALDIQDDAGTPNNYLNIDTTGELMAFDNNVTNPDYTFLGTSTPQLTCAIKSGTSPGGAATTILTGTNVGATKAAMTGTLPINNVGAQTYLVLTTGAGAQTSGTVDAITVTIRYRMNQS